MKKFMWKFQVNFEKNEEPEKLCYMPFIYPFIHSKNKWLEKNSYCADVEDTVLPRIDILPCLHRSCKLMAKDTQLHQQQSFNLMMP